MSVDSIVRYFRTRILIMEASSYQNEIIPSLIKDDTVKYTFLVDKDPVFYKTKYLNILAKQVDNAVAMIQILAGMVIILVINFVYSISFRKEKE